MGSDNIVFYFEVSNELSKNIVEVFKKIILFCLFFYRKYFIEN